MDQTNSGEPPAQLCSGREEYNSMEAIRKQSASLVLRVSIFERHRPDFENPGHCCSPKLVEQECICPGVYLVLC